MTTDLGEIAVRPDRRALHRSLLRDALAEPRRTAPRRRAVTAVLAVVAVLVAAPAFATVAFGPPWGWGTSPEQAARETGNPVLPRLTAAVDGNTWQFFFYRDGAGLFCASAGSDARDTDTPRSEYGCQNGVAGPLFPTGALRVNGPATSRNASSSPGTWDRTWLYGLAEPSVARVVVSLSDCSTVDALFRPNAFEGKGAFAYVEPHELVRAKVWPYRLGAFDAAGTQISSTALPAGQEPNGDPMPPARC
jgi:hypothetical protein